MPHTAVDAPHDMERELIAFLSTRLDPDDLRSVDLDSETLLFEEGLINSIQILALIGFVELRLDRRLDDEEIVMPRFRSVRSIVNAFFHQ